MTADTRGDAARFYDLFPPPWDDVPFYRRAVPGPGASVLELGCGTGRVLVPLAGHCGRIVGVDGSEAMLALCRGRLADGGDPPNVRLVRGDITRLELGERFDLIIAPFRVMQNLETDEQLDGLMRVIRTHLADGGTAILNAFNPYSDRQTLLERWVRPEELFDGQVQTAEGLVRRFERQPRLQRDPLVLYPELIYRRCVGGRVVEQATLRIAMRVWYPPELIAWIESHGFVVRGRWGGYQDEPYGEGGELVVAFGR